MIKAILWNHKRFKEVNLDPNSKTPIYQQVNKLIDARTMASHTFNKHLDAYVDDEGLLIDEPIYGAISVHLYTGEPLQRIAGKILFVNHNPQGETIDLTYDQMKIIHHLQKHIQYTSQGGAYETLLIPYY